MEQKDYTLSKVSWITKMKSTPPLTQEYIDLVYLRYRVMISYLQSHKLTTREILDDDINDEFELRKSDLTEKGFEFYKNGIIPWIKKIDRSVDRKKTITDISFLDKKLQSIK